MQYKQFNQIKSIGQSRGGRVQHTEIIVDGIKFDSKAEHDRYLELRIMEMSGHIQGLECHPRYELIPAQKIPGHRMFKAAHYTADFAYTDNKGERHVEDVKSTYTREDQAYILRRKLMYLVHGIYVEEVIR